ncbi:hypothetical protein [uncultured Treponema sp.]|uniref:hypothetical protein n=1 Tax=uncultured Treponema sp. TaxID=162155 RepID=UPI0025947E7C|nr:hypothetical protein [uncultured Treponema sp.]
MKKIFRILLALSSVVCLVSCGGLTNPQIPQSVSIATDAQFKANMGTASYDLSDKFGSDALLKKMQDALGSQVGIYDYNEGNNVLTYMIRYPIYEVPIDIQSYLQNLNLDEILKSSDMGLNFTQEVSIPEVTQTGSQTVQIDVASKIRESVSENFSTSYTIAVPEGLPSIPGKEQNTSISSILSAAGAEKITVDSPAQTIEYETGSAICIDISRVDPNALSDDYKFSLSAAIYAKDDTSKTNKLSSANVDARDGGKLLLPLDVTGGIPGDFFIAVDGTVEGSHPADTSYAHAYSMKVSLTRETTPTVITGIEKSSADLGIESYTIQDMSVSLAELEGLFKNAEVGEGYLALSAELPAGWKNLKATAKININGAGLENLAIADVKSSSKFIDKKLDLRAKKIDLSLGKEITVTGSVDFEIFGATIDLRSGDLEIGYEASITKLNSVVIDLNSDKYSVIKEKLNYSLPTDGSKGSVKLPSEMLNYVKSIGFGELAADGNHYKHKEDGTLSTEVSEGFGIKARFVNTLPLQSDINLTLSSAVFNLTGANAIAISIPGNTGDTYEEKTWAAWPSVDFSALDKTVDHYVDMSLTAAFENDELKLQDVVMGTSYKIGFELESMLYDFDSVVLNTSDIAYSGEQSLEGFDLNNMLGGMGIAEEDIKKLGIPSLPVYFYAQTPADDKSALGNLLGGIGISGDVSISYDTTTTSADGIETTETKTVNLLADADGNVKPIRTVDAVKWPASGSTIDASKCTFTKDSNYSFSFTDANEGGLAQIISSFPSNLKFTYSIGLTNNGGPSEITVYSSMIPKVDVSEGSVTTTESATSLKIDMAAILPLSIKIGSDISLDIMELADSEWSTTNAQKDLLNREDASTYQEYVDYIDSLESFTMSYRMNVEEFISGIELGLSITDEASGLSKNVPVIGSGQKEMVIKGEEIKRILTTYPFHPSVKLELPANTITIKRSAFIKSDDAAETPKIGVNVGLKIKMDGDTPITVWGGKK